MDFKCSVSVQKSTYWIDTSLLSILIPFHLVFHLQEYAASPSPSICQRISVHQQWPSKQTYRRHTSAFPQNLPPREQSWKQRNCPNMRVCWHVSLSSYDPRNCPDKRTLWRRIAMILILFARTAMSVLTVISAVRTLQRTSNHNLCYSSGPGILVCDMVSGNHWGRSWREEGFRKLIVSLNWQPLLCWPIPTLNTHRAGQSTL